MNFLTPASVRSSSGPSGGGGPSGASVVVVSLIEISENGRSTPSKAGAEDGLQKQILKGRRQFDPSSSKMLPDFSARRSESRSVFRAMTWSAPAPAARAALAWSMASSSAANRFMAEKACVHWDLALARVTS